MDDFDARWRALDGGDQSYVRRASRRGRRVDASLAPAVVGYSRRRLARWWLDAGEILPAIVVLLLLPYVANRDVGVLTAEGDPVVRAVAVLAVGAGFVLWRRWRYSRAIALNDGPGEPAGSR